MGSPNRSGHKNINTSYSGGVQRPSSPRKKPKRGRWILLIVILLLIGAAALILWGIFGRVELGSDDVSRPTGSGTTSSTSGSTTEGSTTEGSTTEGSTTEEGTQTTAPSTTAGTTALSPEGAKLYQQPAGAAWNLILVNDYNAVPDGYEETTTMVSVSGGQMDARAAEAYQQMLADGAAYDIRGVSLFRPQSLQESLFAREVEKWRGQGYGQEEAEQKANTVVKRPGYSEHNTGLAADVGGSGNYSLNQDFENTEAYAWLIEHCADYGFILRFPKDKEDITGVIFEPWHYRYVGVEAAQEIMSRGLCLEEYLYEKGL